MTAAASPADDHRPQRALELGRLGRRGVRLVRPPGRRRSGSRPCRSSRSGCPAASSAADGEERGRRLAVRAGDPDDRQLVRSDRRTTRPRPSRARPASSSTTSCGRSTSGSGRSTIAAAAPAAAAAATKSCPSTCSPGTATNSDPGPTSRESWVTPRTGIVGQRRPRRSPGRRAGRRGAGPRRSAARSARRARPAPAARRRASSSAIDRRSVIGRPARARRGRPARPSAVAARVEDPLVGAGQLEPLPAERALVLVEPVQRVALARLAARARRRRRRRGPSRVQPSRMASWIARQRSRWSAPGWSVRRRRVVAGVDGRQPAAVAVQDQAGERLAPSRLPAAPRGRPGGRPRARRATRRRTPPAART